jgi:CRISPR-associated protein Cas1
MVLRRLMQCGAAVFVADDKHMPCMAGLPFDTHSRVAGVQRLQLSMTEPFQKRCWQAIVKRKIENQAECARLAGSDGWPALLEIAAKVSSGDGANAEAWAARLYFDLLFDEGFFRGDDDALNAGLNYGYAVVRAGVARALASHGFLLTQGLHHRSELNAFNLADDFIEPFRPLVDLCVVKTIPPEGELEAEHRQVLVSLLANEIRIEGKKQGVTNAMDIMASSFLAACQNKSPGALKLPELIPLASHSYE